MKRIVMMSMAAGLLAGAGPSGGGGLTDPVVLPQNNRVASPTAAPLGGLPQGPVVIANPPVVGGTQGYVAGYPVNIAWDHVAVGLAILGGMYMLGESASASGSF